jgi:endonuclease YncB( thermonuclease family)
MRALTILAALAVALLLGFASSASAQTIERSCANYLTQETAQWFFWSVGGPESDPYNFDEDRDGVACEHLPCPCRYVRAEPASAPPAPVAPPSAPVRAAARTSIRGTVVRVLDARTLRVRTASGTGDVRLLGIVAPEKARRHCGSTKASAMLSRLARRGERVVLRTDPRLSTFDRAGRVLAYVTGSDGKLLQTEMIRRGYARVSTAKPRFQGYRSFAAAHRRAKKAKKAMWRSCRGNFSRRAS